MSRKYLAPKRLVAAAIAATALIAGGAPAATAQPEAGAPGSLDVITNLIENIGGSSGGGGGEEDNEEVLKPGETPGVQHVEALTVYCAEAQGERAYSFEYSAEVKNAGYHRVTLVAEVAGKPNYLDFANGEYEAGERLTGRLPLVMYHPQVSYSMDVQYVKRNGASATRTYPVDLSTCVERDEE